MATNKAKPEVNKETMGN